MRDTVGGIARLSGGSPGPAAEGLLPLRAAALAAVLLAAWSSAASGGETLDEARAAYLSGSYARAERALRSLSDSGDARAGELLARLLAETGRLGEASALAARLLEKSPREAALAVLAGELALERGELRSAEELFKRALEIDPENRRARVFLKRIYDLTARRAESEKIVDYFWDFNNRSLVVAEDPDPRDFMYVAEAVRGVDAESTKVAWRHFRRAYTREPELLEAYALAGELALDVFDWERARGAFKGLLERNPAHPRGHAGLARLYLAVSKYKEAEAEARAALGTNPEFARARLVLAELHLLDDRYDEARAEIDAALRASPADPDALAMDATWRFATGDGQGFAAAVKRMLALYPREASVYVGTAAVLERRRRFPEALEQYRKAVELDPDGWEGHYGVGMTLVRMGEEQAGYRALEKAFELNPFNVWAYNTLTALDRDFKEGALARRQTEHFVVKISRTEEEVLGEHVEEALEEIWAEETKRFGFTPRGPEETGRRILFEMFADHEDFSARTTGVPNLGALGATLGQIVTMPSPSWGVAEGRPFRWTAVARHEFAHVVTLQLTDYRIPRWFTEGVSVYVEGDPQALFDMLLARAVAEGELAPLSRLNSLFTRPETPQDVALGYYQAALAVQWMVEQFGFGSVLRACAEFGRGRSTPEALRAATGLAMDELDARIGRYIAEHAARIRAWSPPGPKELSRLRERLARDPSDAAARARLAEGYLAAAQYEEARAEAERALRDSRSPQARAHVVAGLVSKVRDRDDAAALASFEKAARLDPEDFLARLYLGLALWNAGRKKEAAEALDAAHALNPRFVEPVPAFGAPPLARVLLRLLNELGESKRALAAASRAAAADPADFEASRTAGEAALAEGAPEEASRWLAQALSANPFDARSQKLFGRAEEALASRGGRSREAHLSRAARAYRAAAALPGRDAESLSGLARVLWALGRREESRAAVERLRQLDPAAAGAVEKDFK